MLFLRTGKARQPFIISDRWSFCLRSVHWRLCELQ